MVSRPERLLRHREDPASATFLELFFDLAFVFALNQLTTVLLVDLSIAAALRAAILLAALWWLWVATTWSADWYAPGALVLRMVLIGAALGGLLMGAAAPNALGGRAELFAGALVATELGRGLLGLVALRNHPRQRRSLRILCWSVVSGVLWMAGVFTPAARVPLWLLALTIHYLGPSLGWPVPGLGRATPEELQLTGRHLAERFQQVFVISLGELVLTAGLGYTRAGTGLAHTVAFVLVFATAVLLGLLYVTPAGQQLAPAIERADPTRFGAESAYLHLVIVGGVVATAAGAELVIVRPDEAGAVAFVVTGPALFLTGRLLLSTAIHRRLSWPRLVGVPLLVVVGVVTADLPLLVATAATTVLLSVVAVVERAGVFTARQVV
ncbi:low temperature requirement protein A [Micromonospora avicenniae]|uniref:Low temperature requirement protein LtrA n=1 Tax=Micromonospora avicenniae TaxID=1198245 RepID=A0A1N6UD06_9ACTN|nr:low temperature requirement protein A [Micromonospora avicenniae]SIQ63492.1 Low temperature requirement protein LtrA [Micromonospora avicenniae]